MPKSENPIKIISDSLADEIKSKCVQTFRARMREQRINAGTVKFKAAQAEYFAGAMTVLEKLGIPPIPYWYICIVSGREIEE